MPVLLRIAIRNLLEHKTKTYIIGILICIGITVMIIGNSMMDTAAAGTEKTFIDNYTGHIMISAKSENPLTLFGTSMNTGNEQVPKLPMYKKIREYLDTQGDVVSVSPQITGYGLFDLENGEKDFSLLFGVEPEQYKKMFPNNIDIVDGDFLKPGEEGICLSTYKRDSIKKNFNIDLRTGQSLVVTGIGTGGFKIRELPIKGFFSLKNESNDFLKQMSIVDSKSLRALLGMFSGTGVDPELLKAKSSLLETDDLDSLFNEDIIQKKTAKTDVSEQALLSILGDKKTEPVKDDSTAWHYLLIRLKNSSLIIPFLAKLNMYFAEQKIDAVAVDWKMASGGFAAMADGIKLVINIIIIIIAIVAIFIIMNTIVISIMERTPEIGTMRALGAQKGFIAKMFIFETLTISIVFGIVGILLGSLFLTILNIMGVPAPNQFMEMLFGGKELRPVLSASSVIWSSFIILLIGLVSSLLYPVWVALKIQPVKAIQSE